MTNEYNDFILPTVDDPIKIKVSCGFRDCHKCCLETEMLLSNEDITRIEKLGYKVEEFCLDPKAANGFYQLQNVDGRCFFLSEIGKCTIYADRPMGCRFYPLILAIDTNEVLVDEDCRETEWFERQIYSEEQIIEVHSLVKTLLIEQEGRL